MFIEENLLHLVSLKLSVAFCTVKIMKNGDFSKNYNCANEIEITEMGINLDKSENRILIRKKMRNEAENIENIEYMSLPVN